MGGVVRLIAPVLAIAAAASLAACSTGALGPEPVIEDVASFHSPTRIEVLKPGQQIKLVVYGAQELSGTFRVSESGALKLPRLGTIQVAGMSPQELEKLLTERLASQEGAPQVSVMLD